MSVLKIHMTYQCTSACDHCRFRSSQKPSAVIDFDMAMGCVEALQEGNDLGLVVLMGGEPGLFPDLTHRLALSIHRLGLAVRVETNAFWANSEEAALAFLEPLGAADASVMFSLDAFHEPFVPPACVERAVRTSAALGMRHNLEMAYLDCARRVHKRDRRTDALLAGMEERLGRSPPCAVYQGNVFYNGRAVDRLAPLVAPGRGVPLDRCEAVPWWSSGSLETLELLILDADGYLSKGCGIAIGNVGHRPVEAILASYDARTHPVFATLLESGPLGLAREAEDLGYVLRTDYADRCHLCQEAREVLRARYPEILVPAQHYL
jgi:hypothetical protein